MWTVETLNAAVDAEIQALPRDLRARLAHIAALIEATGLENAPPDYVKHLEGKLWELRLKARSGIARAIYVAVTGRRVVIVKAFVKKTQKTPLKELATARERAKELE
jgi:phage-related protein